MSANDSSTLIDTPAASKLGENRALYFSEEENRIEKFRPYGVPEPDWLEGVQAAVRRPPASRGQWSGATERRATGRRRRGSSRRDAAAGRSAPPVRRAWLIRPSRPSEPARPGPGPPPITSSVAARVAVAGSSSAPERLRRDIHAPHLDLQRADLVLGDHPPQCLRSRGDTSRTSKA